jgi:glycosyltransferase involved in cell wall biosynthesis
MAAGIPVVAFDGAGPAEIVESNLSGLLVPPGDEASLEEAAERLISDRELSRRLAAGGRRRFNARFAVNHMTDQLLNVLTVESHRSAQALVART